MLKPLEVAPWGAGRHTTDRQCNLLTESDKIFSICFVKYNIQKTMIWRKKTHDLREICNCNKLCKYFISQKNVYFFTNFYNFLIIFCCYFNNISMMSTHLQLFTYYTHDMSVIFGIFTCIHAHLNMHSLHVGGKLNKLCRQSCLFFSSAEQMEFTFYKSGENIP